MPFWVVSLGSSLLALSLFVASVAGLEPNKPPAVEVGAAVGAAVDAGAAAAGWAGADAAAVAPNREDAGLAAAVEPAWPPNRPPAAEVTAGVAEEVIVVAGLFPNSPPVVPLAVAGVDEVVVAELAAVPPKRLLLVVVEAGAVEPTVPAAFAPNNELVDPAVAVAGPDVAEVDGVLLAGAPNKPPAGAPVVAAGLLPKRLPAEDPPPDCAPAKSPGAAGAADVEADEVVGCAALPKSPPAAVPAVDAGFDESVGGAPAGVVDGRENMGLAGVAAVAVVGVVLSVFELGVVLALFPNKELPELANKPDEGAAAVVVVL